MDTAVIQVYLKEPADVKLAVYDSKGKEVITLLEGKNEAGVLRKEWTGRDKNNTIIGSGIYMLYLKAGSYTETKKIA